MTSSTHDRSITAEDVSVEESSLVDSLAGELLNQSLSTKVMETSKTADVATEPVDSVPLLGNDSGDSLKPAISLSCATTNDKSKEDGMPATTPSPNYNHRFDSPPQTPQQRHHKDEKFLLLSLQPKRHNSFSSDENNLGSSPGSVRSYSSQTGRRSLVLSRPAGMRERMQQRLRTAQSERNLMASPGFLEEDERSSATTGSNPRGSVRRRRGSGGGRMTLLSPSLVREQLSKSWSNLSPVPQDIKTMTRPTTETNNDASLLRQLSQKVHQLEEEKEQMQQKQKVMEKEHESAVHRLRAKLKKGQANQSEVDQEGTTKSNSSMTSSASLSVASAMIELQAKLDKAMLKISRLEQEQAHRDDLEDKYQDAQMMIAHLRIQSASTTPTANGRRLSGDSAGTAQSVLTVSDLQSVISKDRDEALLPMMLSSNNEKEEEEKILKASDSQTPSSLLLKDHVVGRPNVGSSDDATTTSDHVSGTLDDDLGVMGQRSRSHKLQKLKEFRRSRESQLKELVLDSQISPTDVQSVIRNLQDELQACKSVIELQSLQLQLFQEQLERGQEPSNNADDDDTTTELEASSIVNKEDELSIWKAKYRTLQQRFTKLEMDRAWGEFQLRDRITTDALKFHKRLRHWKEQSEDLQRQLEETMDQNAKETKDLRTQISQQEQLALTAEQDLQEYKLGMQQTLKEYSITQERLAKTTAQLAKYHHERSSGTNNDPTIIQQAQFIEKAMERKEGKNASWSAGGWIGKMRQRVVETDPAVMG